MRKFADDRMEGSARQAKGKIKEGTGRITRHRSLQVKGMLEKNVGKARRVLGRARSRTEQGRN